MAPFRFSLQQVLDYREQLEDQAKIAFARIQAEVLTTQHRLDTLKIQLEEQEQALYNGNLDMMDRWLREHFVKGLRDDIGRTARMLSELVRMQEEARLELIAKAKDRKVLEKFKEKQADRHAHEERLTEQRTYDETASIRFKAATF